MPKDCKKGIQTHTTFSSTGTGHLQRLGQLAKGVGINAPFPTNIFSGYTFKINSTQIVENFILTRFATHISSHRLPTTFYFSGPTFLKRPHHHHTTNRATTTHFTNSHTTYYIPSQPIVKPIF